MEVPAPVEPAPQPIETAVATEALPEPTPKKKIPKKKWFIIGGIVTAVIALILGLAAGYVYKAKKSGKKCIGCPDSGSCSGNCGGCSCGCGRK